MNEVDTVLFDKVQASFDLRDGVAHSDDFLLKGRVMDSTGQGWIDLKDLTMDCTLKLALVDVPAFPLRVYGDASDPNVDLGAATHIVDTLGSVGSSAVGILKGVVTLPYLFFKIFQPQRGPSFQDQQPGDAEAPPAQAQGPDQRK